MVVVLMGVSGSGKTTVGQLLAADLHWEFHDGDALHSAANRARMSRGIPLTDAQRMPWLRRVRRLIDRCLARGTAAVIACSALKQAYRNVIVSDPALVQIVYLKGSQKLIAQRLANRKNHFMPPALLQSQFDALEEPRDAAVIDISGPPRDIVDTIRAKLGI